MWEKLEVKSNEHKWTVNVQRFWGRNGKLYDLRTALTKYGAAHEIGLSKEPLMPHTVQNRPLMAFGTQESSEVAENWRSIATISAPSIGRGIELQLCQMPLQCRSLLQAGAALLSRYSETTFNDLISLRQGKTIWGSKNYCVSWCFMMFMFNSNMSKQLLLLVALRYQYQHAVTLGKELYESGYAVVVPDWQRGCKCKMLFSWSIPFSRRTCQFRI